MTQTVEDIRYQLEEWLAQGFTSPEDRANYQALKDDLVKHFCNTSV